MQSALCDHYSLRVVPVTWWQGFHGPEVWAANCKLVFELSYWE